MIDLGESRADVLVFLRGLFADLRSEERIEVRVLNQGKAKTWMCGSPEEVVSAVERGANDGENVYFGVLPRRKGVKSGKREDVTRGTAAWIDLDADISVAEARARVGAYPVKPSYVVKSGHGYHVYWLLSERVKREDLGKLEKLNRAIAEIVGADAACHDAARILRLPGTKNFKHEETRECGFVGKPAVRPVRHTLDQLIAASAVFSRSAASTGSACSAGAGGSAASTGSACSASSRNGWDGVAEGSRNNELFKKACDLRERRVPLEMALGALKEWNQKNQPPLPEQELTDTVRRVYTPTVTGVGGGVGKGGEAAGAVAQTDDDPLKCYSAHDLTGLAPTEVEFTVDRLVPSNGVTIFSGEGGIGKSFIALDMAMAVACGGTFADRFACKQGPVLYVDLENDPGTIGRRLKQLAIGRGVDPDSLDIYFPMYGMPGVELQQDTSEGRAWLWAAVKKYQPRLVVIDSLIACHSGDENNNVAMRQLMSGLDGLARWGDLGLLLVHHQRKKGNNNDAGQLMRGASDLRNSVVSHLAAKSCKDGAVRCEHDKCRPAQVAQPFRIAIHDREDGGVVVEPVSDHELPVRVNEVHEEREALVIETLRSRGPCTPQALYAVLDCSERTAQRTFFGLIRRGLIVKLTDGLYRLTDTGNGGDNEDTDSLFGPALQAVPDGEAVPAG